MKNPVHTELDSQFAADGAPQLIARLLERSSDAVVVLDPDDRYLYLNANAERLMGRPAADLIGQRLWSVFAKEDYQRHASNLERARAGEDPVTDLYYSAPLDRWVETNIYILDGNAYIHFRDVSASKRALLRTDQLLAFTEQLARAITVREVVDAVLGTGLSLLETDSGLVGILSDDKQTLRAYFSSGVDADISSQWRDIPANAPVPVCEAIKRKEAVVYIEDAACPAPRYPILKEFRDRVHNQAIIAAPLMAGSQAIGALGLSCDPKWCQDSDEMAFFRTLAGQCAVALERVRLLESERAAQDAIRSSEEHLRLAITSAHLGSWQLDLRAREFIYVSGQCKAHFGRPSADPFTYSDLFKAIYPEDRQRVHEAILHAISSHTTYSGEYRCVWPSGSLHWIEAHAQPIYDQNGDAVTMVGVTRDVTAAHAESDTLRKAYVKEHRVAETLQNALLTSMMDGVTEHLEIQPVYRAAWEEAQVGGDFYDVFTLDQDRTCLVIGDVSGKGLRAASRAAEAKYTLRAYLLDTADPQRALVQLNRHLYDAQERAPGDGLYFICASIVVYNHRTGSLVSAAAGLEGHLIVRRSESMCDVLPTQGLPLGITLDAAYHTFESSLEPGDLLAMTTDGIPEARSRGEMFGTERLAELLQKSGRANASLPRLSRVIVSAAAAFAGGDLHDDVCLLLARPKIG